MVGSVTLRGTTTAFFETQNTVKEAILFENILYSEGAEYNILEVFALKKS